MGPLGLLGLAAMALAAAGALGQRHGVGPWDLDDRPQPQRGGAALSDPSRLVQAQGFKAEFPGGIQVRLVAISRSELGPKELDYWVGDRSWTPDGAPYSGPELRNDGDFPSSGTYPDEIGTRFLTFEITSTKGEDLDVYGYLPDGIKTLVESSESLRDRPPLPGRLWAAPGRDVPRRLPLESVRSRLFMTPILVEAGFKSRYRFALARGDWKPLLSTTRIPTKPKTQEIARGEWGSLRLIGNPGWGTSNAIVEFRIDPVEPVEQSFRVRAFGKDGHLLASNLFDAPQRAGISESALDQVGRIEVDSRPFSYVEFRGIHFEPDPKLWGESYWGSEGERAVVDVEGIVRLNGLIRRCTEDRDWASYELFAPDGKHWRESPEMSSWRWNSFGPTKGEFQGLLRWAPSLVRRGQTARVDIFASTSPEPGRGLGERVQSSRAFTDGTPRPYSFDGAEPHTRFSAPSTPYVQFAVRVSEGKWTLAGSAPPPKEPVGKLRIERIEGARKEIHVGSLDLYYEPKDRERRQDTWRKAVVTWDSHNNEARLVAKLRSGQRVLLRGYGEPDSQYYEFELNQDSEPASQGIALKDIEAFEVETRAYGEPKYLVAKLPPPAPRQ